MSKTPSYWIKAKKYLSKKDTVMSSLIKHYKSPRTVIIEFPSYDEANNFYSSKEYQAAHSILKGFADRQHQTVEGI